MFLTYIFAALVSGLVVFVYRKDGSSGVAGLFGALAVIAALLAFSWLFFLLIFAVLLGVFP